MLIALHLFARDAMRQPLLYPSPVFERRKDEYIDRMYEVSQRGNWAAWIRFFLRVLADAAREAVDTADRLLALQKGYRERLQKAGKSANLLGITDFLFRHPIASIPQIAGHAGVTYRSAQLNVTTLIEAGIVHELAGTSNPKYFAAREILDVVGGPRAE
jgi:Fic family protein